MNDYNVHVVIDCGASTIKVGFNGENAPRVVIPNVYGTLKKGMKNLFDENGKIYVGHDAIYNSSNLNLGYPMKNGKFPTEPMNIERMEKIFQNIFDNELKIKVENHNVFLTESLFTSKEEREKYAELMFESIGVFNLHFEPQSVMSLYSTAKTSGLIVNSGETLTEIVPIYEGYIIPQGIRTTNVAGARLTMELIESLKPQMEKLNVTNSTYIARKIKEKYFEIDLKGNLSKQDLNLKRNLDFELPDGNRLSLSSQNILLPEAIFNPGIISDDSKSLQDLILESLLDVDLHLRKEFLSNFVLGGGNTMIKNYSERLKTEVNNTLKENKWGSSQVTKINSYPERIYSSWIGSSAVCSFSKFQELWVSKNDYEEQGKHLIAQNYLN